MRPTRVTQSGAGNSSPVVVDTYGRAQIGIQVVVTGTFNYTVQQTFDNLFDSSITPTWSDFPDPNIVGATTSQTSMCNTPPMALRLVGNSGAGSAVMTVLSSATN